MTVANSNNRTRLAYSGLTYDFTFKIDDDSEILVYSITAAGVATLKTLTTDYTVSISTVTEGGTVTLTGAISGAAEILMIRNKAYNQGADIPTRGGFNEAVIEGALDDLAMQIQQLKELLDYAVKQANTAAAVTVTIPEPEDGLALVWDGVDGTMTNAPVDAGAIAAGINDAEAAAAAAEAAQAATEASQAIVEAIEDALAGGTAGQALTSIGGGTPVYAGMTTRGDIEYRNATTRTRLAPGTAGQFLKTNGAGADPEWSSQVGFGDYLAGPFSTNTPYLAATDLIVTAIGSFNSATKGAASMDGLSDAASTPTTRRAYLENTTNGYYGSITFAVKKGHYWSVTYTNMANESIQAIPHGS